MPRPIVTTRRWDRPRPAPNSCSAIVSVFTSLSRRTGRLQACLQQADQVEVGPLEQWQIGDTAGLRVDDARDADADPEEALTLDAGGLECATDRRLEQRADGLGGGVVAARHGDDGEGGRGEIRDRRDQVVGRDLDADDVPGGRVDAQDRGRTPDGRRRRRRRLFVLKDVAILEERCGDRGHRGWGEARDSREFRAGESTSLADEVQDERSVQVSDELAMSGPHWPLESCPDK